VLANTKAEVAASGGVLLEVERAVEVGVVGAREIGRAADNLGDSNGELVQDLLRELAGGGGGVLGGVDGEGALPVLGELALNAALKLLLIFFFGGEDI